MLEIRLLGELTVSRDGRSIALPQSKKTRALLAYLAATGRPQLREKLCGLLWDGPDDPRAALRWSLTKLRPLVDDPDATRLVADRERVELVGAGAVIDLAELRAAVPGGVVGGVARGSTEALRGVAKWLGGELVEGLELAECFRWDDWLRGEREAVRRLGVAILAALVERAGADREAALDHARAWVGLEPLDEQAHAAVIRALAELDRKGEALAHHASCARLIERELGRPPSRELERLRIALGAVVVPAAPMPAAPAPVVPAHPLVGRTDERAALARLVAEPAGPALLLLGDPGIGKTRLLEELAALAAARGQIAMRGRAVEAEIVRPFGAWLDAIGDPSAFRVPADGDRSGMFEAIAAWLSARAGDRGLVIVLDDVQWIDEASAALFHFIARARPPGIRLACAARPGDLADNPAALRLVRSMTRERLVHQIGLSPLSAAETAALTEAYAPGVSSERVFAESGGHPLFAVEIARALARGETTWASLDTLIGERLDLLDGTARELVPWAAALGRAFDADVLSAITGFPLAELGRALAELEQRAIVRARDAGWELAHDLIRNAAYIRISEPRRRLLHRQIARSLAGLADPDGELAVEVAHHAGLGGDSALCAEACLTAAQRCLRMFAPDEAAAHAMRGIAHASRLVGEARARLQIDLLCVANHADTRRQHRELLASQLERAILDAQAAGCHAEAARGFNELSHVHYQSGNFARAHLDSLDAAERAQNADPVSRAQALAFSAQCLALLERELPKVEELVGEAARLLRSTGAEVAELPFALAMLRQHQGEDEAALTLYARATELAELRGVHWLVGYSRSRSALIELARGRYAEARAHAIAIRDIAVRMGEGGDLALGGVVLGIAELAVDGTAPGLESALAELRAVDAPALYAAAAVCLAEVELARGRVAEAARHAGDALAAALRCGRASETAHARAIAARIATIEGRAPELDELRSIAFDQLSARAQAAVSSVLGD